MAADVARTLRQQGVRTQCWNYTKWEREMISSIITSSKKWIRRYKKLEKRRTAEVACKLRQLVVSKKWAKNDVEKIMQRGDHRDGLVMLIPMVETVRKMDSVWVFIYLDEMLWDNDAWWRCYMVWLICQSRMLFAIWSATRLWALGTCVNVMDSNCWLSCFVRRNFWNRQGSRTW